ncbi:hypothetical protein JL721_12522 [Aureococcus anophagefferens]|nr:hypothetical protein JL721_12522 [Aureococcus anophagefferens]
MFRRRFYDRDSDSSNSDEDDGDEPVGGSSRDRMEEWCQGEEAVWLCRIPTLAAAGEPDALDHLTRALAVAKPRLATALAAATVDAVLRQRERYAHLPMLRRLCVSFIYVDTDAQGHVADAAPSAAFDFTRAARQSVFLPGGGPPGGGRGPSLQGRMAAGSRLAEFMRHTPCFDTVFNLQSEVSELARRRIAVEQMEDMRNRSRKLRADGAMALLHVRDQGLRTLVFYCWRALRELCEAQRAATMRTHFCKVAKKARGAGFVLAALGGGGDGTSAALAVARETIARAAFEHWHIEACASRRLRDAGETKHDEALVRARGAELEALTAKRAACRASVDEEKAALAETRRRVAECRRLLQSGRFERHCGLNGALSAATKNAGDEIVRRIRGALADAFEAPCAHAIACLAMEPSELAELGVVADADALALERSREIARLKADAREDAEQRLHALKSAQLAAKLEALPGGWEGGGEGAVPRQVLQLQEEFDRWAEKRRGKVALRLAGDHERARTAARRQRRLRLDQIARRDAAVEPDAAEQPGLGAGPARLVRAGDASVGCALLARLMLTHHGLGPVRGSGPWRRRRAATRRWLELAEDWEAASGEVASVLEGTAGEAKWRAWRGKDLETTDDPAAAFESALAELTRTCAALKDLAGDVDVVREDAARGRAAFAPLRAKLTDLSYALFGLRARRELLPTPIDPPPSLRDAHKHADMDQMVAGGGVDGHSKHANEPRTAPVAIADERLLAEFAAFTTFRGRRGGAAVAYCAAHELGIREVPRKVEVIHEDHVEAEKDAAEARALVLGRGELSDRGRLEALIKPYSFDDVDAWGRGAEAVLRDYFEDLRRVFRFYAASGEAGSADEMSAHEWMVFLGDCRIIDKRHTWCFRRGSPDDADECREKFALFRFTKDTARRVFDMTLDAEDEARRLAAEERKRAYYEESLEEVRRVQAEIDDADPELKKLMESERSRSPTRDEARRRRGRRGLRDDAGNPRDDDDRAADDDDDDEADGGWALDDGERELGPGEWVEALLYVAMLKLRPPDGRDDHHAILPPDECLRRLVEDVILPRAAQSNRDTFRGELAMDAVQKVFRKHRVVLARIFRIFATAPAVVEGHVPGQPALSGPGFLRMMRDARVVTTPADAKHDFPAGSARKVFQDVQLGEDSAGSTEVGGGGESMIYPEFLEALGAIAVYKNTNPYISLQDKLETFLSHAQTGFVTCLNTAIKKDKRKLKLATSAASAANKAYAAHGGRAAMAVISREDAADAGRGRRPADASRATVAAAKADEGSVTKSDADDRPWEDMGDRDRIR